MQLFYYCMHACYQFPCQLLVQLLLKCLADQGELYIELEEANNCKTLESQETGMKYKLCIATLSYSHEAMVDNSS